MLKDKVFTTNKLTDVKTPIYRGVKGINVELVSFSHNPYKGMCDMALATWGDKINKWEILSPSERFHVVLKVLQNKALPLGRESPSFLFSIWGVSRASFDQIARQRVGSTFSSLGWNNIHTENGFRITNEIIENNDKWIKDIETCVNNIKELYSEMIKAGVSWQSARDILPLGMLHWFHFNLTYESLCQFCSRRLCFGEKEDTVATAWLMRERIKEVFPLLSYFLRPRCDWSKKCNYHVGDSLPEEMGTLFEPCGRNKCVVEKPNVDFHRASTQVTDLEIDLNICIPRSNEDIPIIIFEDLNPLDKVIFNAS